MFFLLIEEEKNRQHGSERVIGVIVADNMKEAAKKIGKKVLETNSLGEKFVEHPFSGYDCWLTPIEEVSTAEQFQQIVEDLPY